MKILIKRLAGIAAGASLATSALAQSAGSLVVPIENEPAPKLFVEPPLPGPLANAVAFIPYRVENMRILPIGGPAARKVSPRVGHLCFTVDDLPWAWADYGQSDTIILVNMPRGKHKVLIEVVDPEGGVLTAQSVTFTSPYKGLAQQIQQVFDKIIPEDADPGRVAGAIACVVDAPFGERPFRVHVDPSEDGASIAFAVIDRVRNEMLHRMGLADLLEPRVLGSVES